MPKGNRNGPRGAGSMSGRGAGLCSGFNMPGFANPEIVGPSGGNRGWRGQRLGACNATRNRGRRKRPFILVQQPTNRNHANGTMQTSFVSPQSEQEALKQRSRTIQTELKEIKARLEIMESQED